MTIVLVSHSLDIPRMLSPDWFAGFPRKGIKERTDRWRWIGTRQLVSVSAYSHFGGGLVTELTFEVGIDDPVGASAVHGVGGIWGKYA
ncbi:hypothetical protein NQ315_013788 [Exocentrus adspersus]|uniref:Ammonium transporter AmtB-like domain-containing protein n=1 Tax=Exocentrus adspersus TaxID=1586481 RepID=A0AAV8W4P6_9CUCU|nr:hypothetical protein NQ315_013788 [Exocentrus adspersus]